MAINKLQLMLEDMSEQELSRFVKRCMCLSMQGATKIHDVDANIAMDMAYVECASRGNERLYDMACESVTKHPEICDAA